MTGHGVALTAVNKERFLCRAFVSGHPTSGAESTPGGNVDGARHIAFERQPLPAQGGPATEPVSIAIEEIEKIADGSIAFRSFSIGEPGLNGIIQIQAQGVAPTREILVKFKTDILASESFKTAEIPISDLAQDVNLPFVMTITFTSPK